MKLNIVVSRPTRERDENGNRKYIDESFILEIPTESIPIDVYVASKMADVDGNGYIKQISVIKEHPQYCREIMKDSWKEEI